MEATGRCKKQYRKHLDECIRGAAATLAYSFAAAVEKKPEPAEGTAKYIWFLYLLEKAGTLAYCTRFGEHDWYDSGAEFLVGRQQLDGHWVPTSYSDYADELVVTCFALSFLSRATVPLVQFPPGVLSGGDIFEEKGEKKQKARGKKTGAGKPKSEGGER